VGIPPPPPVAAAVAAPASIPPPPPPPPVAPPVVAEGSADRSSLLSAISGFKKGKLKKQTTIDKSGPRV